MRLTSPTFHAALKYTGQPRDGIYSFEGLGGARWVHLDDIGPKTFTKGEIYGTSIFSSGVIKAVGPLATGEVFENANPIFSSRDAR